MILLGVSLSRPFSRHEREKLSACLPARRQGRPVTDDAVLAAHGLLRIALRRAGVEGAELVGSGGEKPRLSDAGGLHVSLSHTDGAALCALSEEAVGVDVQAFRIIDVPRIRRALGVTAGEREDLLWLWTRREAAAKLTGQGIAGLRKPPEPGTLVYTTACFPGCAAAVATRENRTEDPEVLTQEELLVLL